jgi:hypothetical protein
MLSNETMQRIRIAAAAEAATRIALKVMAGELWPRGAISLSDTIGQRVQIDPQHAKEHGLPIDETFAIVESRGLGDDCFLKLKDARGRVPTHFGGLEKWVRATEVIPARVTPENPPRVVERA